MPPMHIIDLTYVGRGIHEELIAYVAETDIAPLRRSYGPIRHPLAFDRFPG